MKYRLKKPFRLLYLSLIVLLISIYFLRRDFFLPAFWTTIAICNLFEYFRSVYSTKKNIIQASLLCLLLFFVSSKVTDSYTYLKYTDGSYIRSTDLKQIINDIEKSSLAKDFTNSEDYLSSKKHILEIGTPTKDELKVYIDAVKKADTCGKLKYMYMDKIKNEVALTEKINNSHQKD